MSAGPGPIAAEDFAVDQGRSNGLFGGPVAGFEVVFVQEGQHWIAIFVQVIAKRAAALASGPHGRKAIEAFLQSPSCDRVSRIADASVPTTIPQLQRVEGQALHPPGESRTPGSEAFDDFLRPSQQTSDALLMPGVSESVEGRPAVMGHASGIIHSEHIGGNVQSVTGTDHIEGEEIGDKVPQPVQSSADLHPVSSGYTVYRRGILALNIT